MNPGTIIVGLILLSGVILAIRSVIRQHKSGGCSGSCGSCSGCSHEGGYHQKPQNNP